MLPGTKYLPEDFLRVAWRRKWLIVLPFVVISTVTALVAWRWPDTYQSDTLILVVPQQVPESYVKSTVTTRIEDRLGTISQQILSRARLERIIQDFNLYPRERRLGIIEDVVDQMRKDIEVQIIKGDAFRISYRSQDPRTAMKVTERLASEFTNDSLMDRQVLADSTTSFLETQLADARRRLEEAEKKVAEYKIKHTGELPTERESNLQVLNNLQLQVQALTESINRDKERRYQLDKQTNDLINTQAVAPNVTVSGDDPTSVAGGTVAAQLEAAKAQLRLLELKYKPDHPDVGRMKRVIRDLEAKQEADALQRPLSPTPGDKPATPEEAARQLRLKAAQAELDAVDRQIAQKLAEEQRLRGMMVGYQARIEATATRESELTGLTRDYETLRKTYDSLLAKQEDSKVSANLERRQIGEQFKPLDPARLPEKPISPNRPLIDLVGALAGLGMGVGLAALLEYRDTSFRTDDEVVNVLSLPVVAVIPLMLNRSEREALRRRTLLIGSATAVVVVGALAVAAWFVWRYQF